MDVWRPCDTTESAVAWASAVKRQNGPSSLIFSRQNCPFVKRDAKQTQAIYKGGYVMRDDKNAQAVLMATGSEVAIALETAELLKKEGIAVRIVSMPSTSVFDKQSKAYKDSVLPAGLPRIAIEAGVTDYWWKYACSAVHGVDTFGESAPAGVLYKHFGLTAEAVAKTVRQCI
jgi:transketolase